MILQVVVRQRVQRRLPPNPEPQTINPNPITRYGLGFRVVRPTTKEARIALLY